jgi:phage terminase small subunit
MRDVNEPKANRLRAAITAAQYIHVKRDDGGKKEERAEKAAEAATGKLAPSAPPKLAVVK